MKLVEPDINMIQGQMPCLQKNMTKLLQLNKEIIDMLLKSNVNEEDIDNYMENADTYETRFNTISIKIENLLKKKMLLMNYVKILRPLEITNVY